MGPNGSNRTPISDKMGLLLKNKLKVVCFLQSNKTEQSSKLCDGRSVCLTYSYIKQCCKDSSNYFNIPRCTVKQK